MACVQYKQLLRQIERVMGESRDNLDIVMALLFIKFAELPELENLLGFKLVDKFIQESGKRLKNALKQTDMVGFLDRHTLVCFLPKLQAPSFAELVGYQVLHILKEPFHNDKRQYTLTPRVSMSIINDPNIGAYELLRQANSAMFADWQVGTFINVYSSDLDKEKSIELDLKSDFQLAIAENRLSLVYQPQVNLSTNTVVGAEALLRWDHPIRGPILTDMMIKVAEQSDLITQLTYWVLHSSMHHLNEICNSEINIRMSINVSAFNLREHDLIEIASEALAVWNIQPHLLTIEITETAIIEDFIFVLDILKRLKKMNIRIALDDFGTGYSSLAVLGKLPLDELKIDMSLIQDMMKQPEQELIVKSIIDLAHALNLEVIAEGVEDLITRERLKTLGCDLIQGYLVSPPLTLPEFIKKAQVYNSKESDR